VSEDSARGSLAKMQSSPRGTWRASDDHEIHEIHEIHERGRCLRPRNDTEDHGIGRVIGARRMTTKDTKDTKLGSGVWGHGMTRKITEIGKG
jgi:hypothetical protein